jgi:multidrug efflux pump subunit AcrA (membrane-fusion protein)
MALKSAKTPINAQAESAIKQLKEELLGLVR